MRFSDEACKYLDKLSRDKNFIVTDKKVVTDYLSSFGITPYEKIIDFQMAFSGLVLTVTNKPDSTFKATLFSQSDIKERRPLDTIENNDSLYFYCGEHKTAQFWFGISGTGQICTFDNENIDIISSSFDKFIEGYAFEDLLKQNKEYENPYFYNLLDSDRFDLLTQDFSLHSTVSDDYNHWLSDGGLTIHKGRWYGMPGFFIHVYGDNSTQCEDFIQLLKDKQIIA